MLARYGDSESLSGLHLIEDHLHAWSYRVNFR